MTKRLRKSRSRTRRCPACGQLMKPSSADGCPLCDFDFGRAQPVTGADVTPFARTYADGEPGWRRMSEWIWFSGTGRIKHIALMQSSVASRRFAWLNVVLLAVALACVQQTWVGWRWVTASPALEPTGCIEPASEGWVRLASAPRPLPPGQAAESYVDLWWNPLQTAFAMGIALAGGMIALWLGLMLTRFGVSRAHAAAYRGEQRMTAALHYATAWMVPVALGGIVLGLRPIAYVGSMSQWTWSPPERLFVLSSGVLAGFGIVMGWFWLVRLGTASPARTRARVVFFFVLCAPVIVAGVAAGWWWGLSQLYPLLFLKLGLSF